MAGFYIHIPFCRKLCYYCDFHFTVSLKDKDRLIVAICKEIDNRKEEFADIHFDTIYFGGGTPSVLSVEEVVKILDHIYKNYTISNSPEITFEANPDDLSSEYLGGLKNHSLINRLSIGIQSFNDRDLVLMNRRHNAAEAVECILRSKEAGFSNINADLIYGVPGMTFETWNSNLEKFGELEINHLSAYHLTFEPKTVFAHYQKKGKISPIPERKSLRQFEMLLRFTNQNNFDHYEISNFTRNGHYSKHNLGYWTGKPYIGVGPSAHSYIGNIRRWNVSNNTKYCQAIEKGSEDFYNSELIAADTAYNDYILTSLRTKWGADKAKIMSEFGARAHAFFCKNISRFLDDATLLEDDNIVCLSEKGIMIADFIIAELMLIK